MQIIPAIDLKENKCVRLTKGKDETSIVFNVDPEKQAIHFEELGCKKLHIVDLDAAFGRPEINLLSIAKIRKSISIPIQLGGGIRSALDAKKYIDLGIDDLIIGSMSIKEPEKVASLCDTYQNRIYLSLDIRDETIMIKGWKEKSNFKLEDFLILYKKIKSKGYVVTDIKNDGMLQGLNIPFIKSILSKINKYSTENKKVIIAGGLTNYDDLNNLKKLSFNNVEGIISGKSFYKGTIDLVKAQKILDNSA